MDIQSDILWYEKLGRWEEALAYWHEREANPQAFAPVVFDANGVLSHEDQAVITRGKTQALHALGDWDRLSEFVQEKWTMADPDDRRNMAPLAAAASWALFQWDLMDEYISAMKADSADRNFYKAILAVHRNQYPAALRHIARARERIDAELTSLTGENYGRAYE